MIQALKEMGLSQSMIAREMGVKRQEINQWCTGARSPSARSISRLAVAMTTLTGKTVAPADVYNLIQKATERKKQEG